jgi:hypothetical protein
MENIKTLEQAKKRINYLEHILWWLTDGNSENIIKEYETNLRENGK